MLWYYLNSLWVQFYGCFLFLYNNSYNLTLKFLVLLLIIGLYLFRLTLTSMLICIVNIQVLGFVVIIMWLEKTIQEEGDEESKIRCKNNNY